MANRLTHPQLWTLVAALVAILAVSTTRPDEPPPPDHASPERPPVTEALVADGGATRVSRTVIAVDATPPPAHSEQEPTSLTVVLRCGDAPIAGSRIELHGGGMILTAETDQQGTVMWGDAPAGAAVLRSTRGCEESIWIEEHKDNRIELVVPSGIEVYGRVVDTSGQAVPSAMVYLARPVTTLRKLDPVAVTQADTDGRFRVLAVPSGAKLGARAPGYQPSTLRPILHPRVRGERHELTIVVLHGGCDIRGTVVDHGDRPVSNAEVELSGGRARTASPALDGTRSYTWPTQRVRTDREGKFRIVGHRPGANDLVVRSPQHAPWKERIRVDLGEDRTIEVRLAPGVALRGRVTAESGSPIAGAVIERSGLDGAWFRGGVPTLTNKAGDYLFTGLAEGELALRIRKEGYASEARKMHVRIGDPIRLDVVLSEHPRVRGRVVRPDGTPCSGTLVTGRAVGSGRPSGKFATTDSHGRFELSCPEGHAWVLHLCWTKGGVEIDSGIAPIRGARSDVVIVVDESRDATAALGGRVMDLDGRPLLGAWLQLRTGGVAGQRQQLRGVGHTSMENGTFSVGRLTPGEYWLRVHSRNASFAPMEFGPYQLAPREERRLGTLQPEAGSLHIETQFEEGGGAENTEALATIYDAKTDRGMRTIGLAARKATRIMLPPGRYYVGGFVKGYVRCESAPFDIAAGAVENVQMTFRRVHQAR